MKGFTKDGKFHPMKPYNKKIRSKREPFNVAKDGVKISSEKLAQMQRGASVRGKRYAMQEDEFPLDIVITKMEKDFEQGLKEHDFTNPKLRNKQWSVGITYEGGFSEESFGFWAQPVDESIEPVKISEWISNDGWSEGLGDESTFPDEFEKKLENDSDFAEREYAKWLASSFEQYDDHWFMQLADAIEDEHQ